MEKSSRYERRPTIAIAGAGIGGLTAAIALTRRGFDVEVFERAEAIRATGAGITVQANAMRVMQRLGVAGAIRRAGETFASGAIYDERGRVIQSMDLGAVLDRLGATSVALHRQRLIEILYEACEVPVRVGRAVTGFEQDELGVRVCFDDGDAARFDVLVGCDGLHSTIRRALFGDESLRYAGYTTWRGIWEVDDEATYRAIGEARGEYWGPGARFGIVPIGGASIYWFAVEDAPAGGADASDVRPALLATFGDWAAPIPEIVASTPADAILRTDVHDRPPRARWCRGRVALLGDAAHPMTPNLGQGAGQAIEDALALAHYLDVHRDDPPAGLLAYEDARRERAHWFVVQSRRMGQIAQWRSTPARRVRDWLFRMTPESASMRQVERMYDVEIDWG
jgi:2-polyprenyl-6-methoxyphenol hydroxylase-like FAD-dependent oxidoreductase